jgi:hypothetical protein
VDGVTKNLKARDNEEDWYEETPDVSLGESDDLRTPGRGWKNGCLMTF